MSVVFIGPPAAGKSRVGKRVARRLGASFADTDKLIAAKHGAIAEFIPAHGEQRFREIEREAVHRALREYDVVSLGGGAVLNPDTQAELASGDHCVILLVASPEAISERIEGKSNRPLLRGIDSWIATYEARREIYERLAQVSFDTSFRPMWQVVNDVRRHLRDTDSPLYHEDDLTERSTPFEPAERVFGPRRQPKPAPPSTEIRPLGATTASSKRARKRKGSTAADRARRDSERARQSNDKSPSAPED